MPTQATLLSRLGVLTIAILAGCSGLPTGLDLPTNGGQQASPTPELYSQDGPSVKDYFGESLTTYYRQIVDTTITCQEGECPDSVSLSGETFSVKDCPFCANDTVVHEEERALVARRGTTGGTFSSGGCTERDSFGFPSVLEIVRITDEVIVARGEGQGTHAEQGDGCAAEYRYHYVTEEIWVLTPQSVGPVIPKISTTTGEPLLTATVQRNQPMQVGDTSLQTQSVTEHQITVACESPSFKELTGISNAKLRAKPRLALLAINGTDVSDRSWSVSGWVSTPLAGGELSGITEINRTARTFRVSSYYNGNYTVAGLCTFEGTDMYSDPIQIVIRGNPNGGHPASDYAS